MNARFEGRVVELYLDRASVLPTGLFMAAPNKRTFGEVGETADDMIDRIAGFPVDLYEERIASLRAMGSDPDATEDQATVSRVLIEVIANQRRLNEIEDERAV